MKNRFSVKYKRLDGSDPNVFDWLLHFSCCIWHEPIIWQRADDHFVRRCPHCQAELLTGLVATP